MSSKPEPIDSRPPSSGSQLRASLDLESLQSSFAELHSRLEGELPPQIYRVEGILLREMPGIFQALGHAPFVDRATRVGDGQARKSLATRGAGAMPMPSQGEGGLSRVSGTHEGINSLRIENLCEKASEFLSICWDYFSAKAGRYDRTTQTQLESYVAQRLRLLSRYYQEGLSLLEPALKIVYSGTESRQWAANFAGDIKSVLAVNNYATPNAKWNVGKPSRLDNIRLGRRSMEPLVLGSEVRFGGPQLNFYSWRGSSKALNLAAVVCVLVDSDSTAFAPKRMEAFEAKFRRASLPGERVLLFHTGRHHEAVQRVAFRNSWECVFTPDRSLPEEIQGRLVAKYQTHALGLIWSILRRLSGARISGDGRPFLLSGESTSSAWGIH